MECRLDKGKASKCAVEGPGERDSRGLARSGEEVEMEPKRRNQTAIVLLIEKSGTFQNENDFLRRFPAAVGP